VMVLQGETGLRPYHYPQVVSLRSGGYEAVGATLTNRARLDAYLARSSWRRFTAQAWEAQALIHLRLLQPEKAVRASLQDVEHTGSAWATHLLRVMITHMPTSPSIHRVGMRLVNPRHFVSRGAASFELARLAEHIGAEREAAALFASALKTGYDPNNPPFVHMQISHWRPGLRPSQDGEVRGCIDVAPWKPEQLVVALFTGNVFPPLLEVEAVERNLPTVPAVLVASRVASPDGCFVFKGLDRWRSSEDRAEDKKYTLGILLPEDAKQDAVHAEGKLGDLRLKPDRGVFDVGTIRIRQR
jgi:hypothetical protein